MKITRIEAEPAKNMDVRAALEWTKQQITQNRGATVEFKLGGIAFRLNKESKPEQALAQYEAILNNSENIVTG